MSEPNLLYASDPSGADPRRFVVMEYPPMHVPVSLKEVDEIFVLWTPWIVSIVRMGSWNMHLFARPRACTLADDELFSLGWPHVAHGGAVCYAPRQFLNLYPREGDTPVERDRLAAIACMQIFLNGNSSYFICGEGDLPLELRHWHRPKDGNSKERVEGFFREWEAQSEHEVLSLHYTPFDRLLHVVADLASYSDWRVDKERKELQHLEGEYHGQHSTD